MPNIKHLVMSGGGPAGFVTYGSARYLSKKDFWRLADIESIYATSIGGYIGIVLSLGYDWDWLDDYLIKRPWDKIVDISPMSIIDVYSKKGLLDVKFIETTILPLFTAKNLSENVTMIEFYEHTKIDIHMFSTEINGSRLKKVDISHTSHPSLRVVDALAMTMAYPFVFSPVCIDNQCFIDGGLMNNYPLRDCIENQKCEESEILSFKNVWVVDDCKVTNDSNIFDYISTIFRKMNREIDTEVEQGEIKNTVRCLIEELNGLPAWFDALSSEKLRRQLIERGSNQAKIFHDYMEVSKGSV